MDIHIPTTLEIYMIAYLTKYEWEYDRNIWTKKGFEYVKEDSYYTKKVTKDFSLEDAYWAQKEKESL